MLITIAALIILVSLLFYVLDTNTRKPSRKSLNLLPGSYGWPILGETLDYLKASVTGTPHKFVTNRMEKYESRQVFKTSLLGEHMAVLCGPAGNKFLFSNENKLVKVWWPSSVRELLGSCLATSSGDEAKQMKKMMAYFLSPDAFTTLYIKTMDMVTQQHIKTHWQGKTEVKVFPTIKLFTFSLACRLFMSLEDTDEILKLATQFNIFLKAVISVPINLPGSRYYKGKKATAAIRTQLLSIVRQRRTALDQKNATHSQDLLSHLLVTPDDYGKYMSESTIVNNIHLMLFASHDTSSVAMTMLMKNLAEHPEIYQKVLTEQNEIASSKKGGEFLQWDDIQKMKYSWNVVCETIRLAPPIIGAFREAIADIKYAGYNIPKGWKLYWSATASHRDPTFFPECEKFDPSRFEEAGPAPHTYVPFGGGPRMCLGKEFARLEMLIFLHNVIRRFKWELQVPNEKIEYDPVPTPVKGLPVRVYPHTS